MVNFSNPIMISTNYINPDWFHVLRHLPLYRRKPNQCGQTHGAWAEAPLADVANFSGESYQKHGLDGVLHAIRSFWRYRSSNFRVSLFSNCEKLFRGTHSQCLLRYRDSVFGLNFHAELFWLLKEQRSGQT